ncbi:MAG: 30S ribosomal protein S18 [Patescibacteria group bacterium]|jgi:small subunit ribosomal protein S18
MVKKSTRRKTLKPVVRSCPFCAKQSLPGYKDSEALSAYITERGKILGKDRTGLCSKHQRRLATQIKRARFLALLPFAVKVK